MTSFIKKSTFLALILVFTAQCGSGENKSSKVKFTVLPGTPSVRNFETKIYTGTPLETSIPKPHVRFSLRIQNSSSERVTILVVSSEVTSYNNGAISTKNAKGFSPNDFETALDSGDARDDDIVVINAGATETIINPFYIGSLPTSDSFFYQIKLTAEGFFGDDIETSTGNFKGDVTFSTDVSF